jgi:hypothetical protein
MQTIAKTIYKQLGGNKFKVMTGSKDFIALDGGLLFSLIKNKVKAKFLRIILSPDNTYTLFFMNNKGREIIIRRDVYADNLQNIFTKITGLFTSLTN